MVKKEKKQVYLRWGILAVIILLVSLLQNTGGLLPRIYSVSAMPLIPLVVCIAMLEREMAGACFGMFAGMLWERVEMDSTPLFCSSSAASAGCCCTT